MFSLFLQLGLIIGLLMTCITILHAGLSKEVKFVVTDENIGDLEAKKLANTDTDEYAIIVTDYGGRVEELVLKSQSKEEGEPQQVLLSHNGDAEAIKENVWWKGMFLVPWANRIANGKYTFYNGSYQLPLNEDSTDPLRKNALHGLLMGKEMTVVNANSYDDKAVLVLTRDFANEEGYPFAWHYEITYTLSEQGFDISIEIENIMKNQPLPVYIGWHPYFACTAYTSVVTFDPCTGWNHVGLNSNMNPTGITTPGAPFDGSTPIGGTVDNPTAYDDEYKATEPASMCGQIKTKLYDPDTEKTVVLYQSENMRFVHVFTGSTSMFGEGSVAIEPMSGMADGYNNHDSLSILSGGETWEGSFGVYLE